MERATYTTQDTLGKLNLSVQGTRSLSFAKVRKGTQNNTNRGLVMDRRTYKPVRVAFTNM